MSDKEIILESAKKIQRPVSPACLLEVAGLSSAAMATIRNMVLDGHLNLTIDWKVCLP